MKKFISFAGIISVFMGLVVASNSYAATHYASTCHLQPKSGDILVNFGNTIILSDRSPNNFAKNVSIPAGKYKVSLEAFDGYKGRSHSDPKGQSKEQYYVKFLSNGHTIATSGTTGDVRDRVEQAYWRGTVNNSLNIGGNVSRIIVQHAVPYRNKYPNSVNPTCMLLEPIKPVINGVCGSANGKTFGSKPTSGLCSVGSFRGIVGNGPWSWTCFGSNGGSDASCHADITSPHCGSAQGKEFKNAPTSGLCSVGSATGMTTTTTHFRWQCTNGTKETSCVANRYIPACGNDVLDSGEKCDDGNKVNGDGCSATCTIESASIKIVKDDNDNHDDTQSVKENAKATFTITVTNIGEKLLKDVEITDPKEANCNRSASETKKLYDGNLLDAGESFSYTCVDSKVSSGYTNTARVSAKSIDDKNTVSDDDSTVITLKVPEPVCGNGKLESNEKCDDGNTVNGDGCSATCTIESKPEPTPTPTPTPQKDEEDRDDSAIGNLVWNDQNKNCIQDAGEEGISGVKLKLYNGNHVKTDRTNSRGRYKFKNLEKGHYRVVVAQETIPEGCYQVCDPDGTKMDQKTNVKVKDGKYHRKADFGYYCSSTTPVVAQSSPRTGAGSVAGIGSLMVAALSAGFVYKRNTKK